MANAGLEKSAAAVADYVDELKLKRSTGIAKEHAYRPALQLLVEKLGGVLAVNDAKKSEFGHPDFVFQLQANPEVTIGYAEAIDVDKSLDVEEKSDQMGRYVGYPNLFLTNYIEFRFYLNGEKYGSCAIAALDGSGISGDPEAYGRLADELIAFLERPPEPITSGKRLAQLMAGKARRIRDNVAFYLGQEKFEGPNVELGRIFNLLKDRLVGDLTPERFANLYAQTIVYGLFLARYHDKSPDTFTRQEARDLLPPSNPFLRDFFDHIAGPKFDPRLAHILDELCAIFAVTDLRTIVKEHLITPKLFEVGDVRDPVVHFYEDFLAAYDPEERRRLGAYYTPLPLVRYMVREVDQRLREDLGLVDGLADASMAAQTKPDGAQEHLVQVLDPAAGTGTFLNETVELIAKQFDGQEGLWPAYVRDSLVPRLHGFEIEMAPYTVAHLKVGLTLSESGVEDFGQRLGIYLTNTLAEPTEGGQLEFEFGLAEAVTEEALLAGDIKRDRKIMVVLGNPPYRAISSNTTEWADSLVDRYRVEPGGQAKLKESKNWLSDDYVKFVAFAETLIERSDVGVMAFVTNHAYIENPTFRGMRWRMATTFDTIDVIDLHGNKRKRERAPDGGIDDNVFGIQQGVAITIAVRRGKKRKGDLARVRHADLWGEAAEKFNALNLGAIEWTEVKLEADGYFFQPRATKGKGSYESGVSVNDLFPCFSTGIVTMGDEFIVGESRTELLSRVRDLVDGKYSEDELRRKFSLGKNYPAWALGNRSKIEWNPERITDYVYRPFDKRLVYFDPSLVWRTREKKLAKHMVGRENLGLIFSRQAVSDSWNHVQVCDAIVDNRVHYSNRGIPCQAPLYLYEKPGSDERSANIDPHELERLTTHITRDPTPEEVLAYCYGTLCDPSYISKYEDFLKQNFPVVPVPKSDEQFDYFTAVGQELIDVQLFRTGLETQTTFPVGGDNVVLSKATLEDGRVWINKLQYFDGVPPEAWSFNIGGYQPASLWIRNRKGSELTALQMQHFQRLLAVQLQSANIVAGISSP
jgi:hypothetical protein